MENPRGNRKSSEQDKEKNACIFDYRHIRILKQGWKTFSSTGNCGKYTKYKAFN